MNIEVFPAEIKEDLEDQSLWILSHIADSIIVIGGWAVRAHLGKDHSRYTLDVDGIASKEDIPAIEDKLKGLDLEPARTDWGVRFFKRYEPNPEIPENIGEQIEKVELRIEISEPRIRELRTSHYFEFGLTEFQYREIPFHNRPGSLSIKVPPVEHLAAVKLGLPADYKNNLDSAVLLRISNIDKTIDVIKENDDWKDMVLRRIPKLIGRINQPGRLENMLAINAAIDIKEHTEILRYIEEELRKNDVTYPSNG